MDKCGQLSTFRTQWISTAQSLQAVLDTRVVLVLFCSLKDTLKLKMYSKDLMTYESLFSQCKMFFSISHLFSISAHPVFSWMLEVCHLLSEEEEVSADFHWDLEQLGALQRKMYAINSRRHESTQSALWDE